MNELKGNSGCKIELIHNNGSFFVRKWSSSSLYNSRLLKQISKQRNNKYYKSPKIIDIGNKNGLMYVDMEYVEGVSLADSLQFINTTELITFIDNFFNISKKLKIRKIDNVEKIIFKKLEDISNKIKYKNFDFKKVSLILRKINWNSLPITDCHGDLTLENVLINRSNEFYYIDFLDSFIDSWIIDASKLLQDFECGWSFRNKTITGNIFIRLLIGKEYLLAHLSKNEKALCYGMLLIHLLRILQYDNSDKMFVFVVEQINKVIKILEGLL